MNYRNPSFKMIGERSILISWEPIINENLLEFILSTKNSIYKNDSEVIVEVIHTYSSLLIKYDLGIKFIYDEIPRLKTQILELEIPKKNSSRLFRIPVCYDKKFGLDLKEISTENKLDISEIIRLHTSQVYPLFFMGFLPGFLYLGGLDETLFCERKKIPRKRVEKGAVGIGGEQTGIYPKSSPGGWQIIGNCPLDFFDPNQDPPSIFRAGDHIQFYAISLARHQKILEQVKNGTFHLKPEIHD